MYDGTMDPFEHLETFKAQMTLHGFPGKVAYRVFLLTLKGSARVWFGSLVPSSIASFEDLALLFLTQFMTSRRRRCLATYLLSITHRGGRETEGIPI